jgi:hypothetical protein
MTGTLSTARRRAGPLTLTMQVKRLTRPIAHLDDQAAASTRTGGTT